MPGIPGYYRRRELVKWSSYIVSAGSGRALMNGGIGDGEMGVVFDPSDSLFSKRDARGGNCAAGGKADAGTD